jgi:tetratricopeptide (TPR) repeat protein
VTLRRGKFWLLVLGVLVALVLTSVLGLQAYWRQSRRVELAEARRAIAEGRMGRARELLMHLGDRWTNQGEVFLLLGECELARGRREEALKAWARVPERSPHYARAAASTATHLINSGRYTPAEDLMLRALRDAPESDVYTLGRALSRLYRFEGRFDEVRQVLRGSWGGSNDPAGVLKELWLLDHSPMPVAAWRAALDKADDQDDRVWLGRATAATLTGDFGSAADWLERCRARRPEDPSVWHAVLNLAVAAADLPAFWRAAERIPARLLSVPELRSLRCWLAGQLGDRSVERRELTALLEAQQGATQALERLAALASQAREPARAKELHSRKSALDSAHDRFRKLVLDDSRMLAHAGDLARLSAEMGRDFDAAAWALLERARPHLNGPGPVRFDAAAELPRALLDEARSLSSPFSKTDDWRASDPATIAAWLADLAPGRESASGPGLVAAGAKASPPGQTEPKPDFVDDAAAAGLAFLFDNGQTPEHLLPETMSGGVAMLDYDGDGWLDVYCVQGGAIGTSGSRPGAGLDQKDRLFRNRGDGTFKDVSDESGVTAILRDRGYGLGVTVGDYDNDGLPDLFVTRLRTYVLLRNRGNRTFEDATERAGLAGIRDNPTSAAFADLDNDGDLDLYVCHYMRWDPDHPTLCKNDRGEYFYCDPSKVEPAPDHAFRNDGGRFRDVSEQAGITAADRDGRGLGVVAADVNDDRLVDLFVANDGTANYLFLNKGGFRFEDVAPLSGVAGNASGGYQAGMGVASGDLDGDGRPELMVTNFYGEGTTLYRNLGDGLFTDISSAAGIGLASRYLLGFGMAMADVTNRGRLDVMITYGHVNDNRPYYLYAMPARLYQARTEGGFRLVDVSETAGLPWQVQRVGRGLAAGDLDNDGRIDALILAQNEPLAYFHNHTANPGHFVTFGLVGTRSNRDGVGARVTVTANGRTQVAWRSGGGSYQSANDPRLHFGLGTASRVETVEVLWPSGRVDRWKDLSADLGYRLVEGRTEAAPLPGFAHTKAARRPAPRQSGRPAGG